MLVPILIEPDKLVLRKAENGQAGGDSNYFTQGHLGNLSCKKCVAILIGPRTLVEDVEIS